MSVFLITVAAIRLEMSEFPSSCPPLKTYLWTRTDDTITTKN